MKLLISRALKRHQTILLVEPEADFSEWAVRQLVTPETEILTAQTADEAFDLYRKKSPDLVIAETHLAPYSGLELLTKIRDADPNALVILMSAFGSTQSVIESMKRGAFDFLRKESLPFNFKVVVDEALRLKADVASATAFKPQLTVEQHEDSIVGQSPGMQQVFKMIGRVAQSEAPVMITGESGSGKELIASAIHRYGRRSTKMFLAINCAAIPENLLESELFGHEKGSFSGAIAQRVGRFEQCSGGTLFLDEIGDMPIQLQSKLLRVLQDGDFTRVGGTETLHADVRVVAATNKVLEDEVTEKRFREDLFYRLNVVRIQIPALRERREDIKLLAEYFLQKIANRKHAMRLKLSENAVKVLENWSWPGNVRELENTLERACVLAATDVLLAKDIPLGTLGEQLTGIGTGVAAGAGESTSPVLDEQAAIRVLIDKAINDPELQLLPWLEKEFTLYAMRHTQGNQVKASKLLGVTRATLRKRLERFASEA